MVQHKIISAIGKVRMFDEVDEERVFTLSEARSLIPRLRRLLARVTQEREVLIGMRLEIDLAREKAEFGGGSPLGPNYLAHMIRFSEAVQEVQYLGVLVTLFPYTTLFRSVGRASCRERVYAIQTRIAH